MSRFSILPVAALFAFVGGCSTDAAAGPDGPTLDAKQKAGETLFATRCFACHSIGQGDRTGPDLIDLSERRDHDWLVRWLEDPVGMSNNDPIGQELMKKYGVPMPPVNLGKEGIEQVLAYIDVISEAGGAAEAEKVEAKLEPAEFEHAKTVYFDRCAGCHGTLRAGATGPSLEPANTRALGSQVIEVTLRHGLPGGMPAWGELGILSETDIAMLAKYVQLDPPDPPALPLEKIRESWDLRVPVKKRPKKPKTKRNWENFFGVILRDAGQVAIIDGDTYEKVSIINTGFAVHILRSSSSGRYFYAVGRDGKVTMIDLWTPEPTLVAQAQGCFDARSVDASKYEGYEDKLLIEGCYWPPQYVVFDGQTLEPKSVTDVRTAAYDSGEALEEVRVAAIIASHYEPLWVVNLKESGHVALVDYSKEGFPMVAKIPAERFLHDGGWDHTQRYFMTAANMRNQMAIVDVKEKKLVAKFETGLKPHPGRGANWEDPTYGWVNGTVHIGEGRLAVYGADPKENPEHAWKVVRDVIIPGTGSLFLKTHDKSPWVWLDTPLNADAAGTRQVCVYSKEKGDIHKCWQAFDHGRAVHFEYNRDGTEVWLSGWDKNGEIVIYDDASLKEKKRITGKWLVTPTGKFNVYNTSNDVY